MEQGNRVIVLIDMDCFYCQVEEKLDPDLKGKPIAVVQYNPWKGGGIIAVNYVARAMGVTRHMRGDEAKEKCPEIQLPSVPCHRGKADISKYRDAGKEVARVLQKFTPLLERASIDEAYLDITAAVEARLKSLPVASITPSLTPNTYALGYDSFDQFLLDVHSNGDGSDSIEFDCEHASRLLVGAVLVSEIRAAVYEETGYRCSAGIAHNKILAKLVCGMHKPNKQTVLPKHSVNTLYESLPLKKVKHLGGKFGDSVCEQLRITNMGELQRFTEKELQAKFDEKNGTWLYNIARGVDSEPVQARFNPKSIGCCKQFRGRSALTDLGSLRTWLRDLGDEVDDRLEKDALENNRTPKQMVVSFAQQLPDGRDASSSRSYNFAPDDQLAADLFASKALDLVLDTIEGVKYKEGETNRKLKVAIKFLGISVGKFEDNDSKKTRKIVDYFAAGPANVTKTNENKENELEQRKESKQTTKKSNGKDYILKKFFQVTDKEQGNLVKTKEDDKTYTNKVDIRNDNIHDEDSNESKTNEVLNTDLDKQESFFAKLLKKGVDNITSRPNSALSTETEGSLKDVRTTTPKCDVLEHGADSNDTDYSESTINEEINKSIALFDENPEDVVRVSSMRDLLNKSTVRSDKSDESGLERNISDTSLEQNSAVPNENIESNSVHKEITELNIVTTESKHLTTESKHITPQRTESRQDIEQFQCPECNKIVDMRMIAEHADYHLALMLRDEERQHARKEKEKAVPKVAKQDETKKKKNEQKNESVASISSFLVKVDASTPTEKCTECGKRVSVEKIAEHLDFHEAQKLNREWNKRPVPGYFTGSGVKKRKTVSPVKKTKATSNSKSIDSFFKQH